MSNRWVGDKVLPAPPDAKRDALAAKIKGWVAGISAEILDAPDDIGDRLVRARAELEAAYVAARERSK